MKYLSEAAFFWQFQVFLTPESIQVVIKIIYTASHGIQKHTNKMSNKIVLKTFGGLANRMRAIDSASVLADLNNIKLTVIWEMSFELNCSFQKLFEVPHNIDLHEYPINGIVKRANDFICRNAAKAGIHLPIGYDIYLYDREIEHHMKTNTDFKELISSYRSVYIKTIKRFYSGEQLFRNFQPVAQLRDTINALTSNFSENTIGVHIRRKDNIKAIRHSPLEIFIDQMNHEISVKPQTKFFLATDSAEDEAGLKDIFGDRIITYPKVLERDSEKGIQDALVDLYCLSNTKKILGSYYSSFSETAAQISDIELIQIYKS